RPVAQRERPMTGTRLGNDGSDSPPQKLEFSSDATTIVTYFRDKYATQKQEREVSLRHLADQIRVAGAPEKEKLGLLKLATFGDVPAPSGSGSLRHDGNLTGIFGVELDYDGETIDIDFAIDAAEKAGLLAIVFTTPSYRPEAPRWRVL